jgi:hypothetical protein
MILLKLFCYRGIDMNDIKNTMCRLRALTREQIYNLQKVMPYGAFDFISDEPCIGVTSGGTWGTWAGAENPTIVTYTEMMQLLGKDMNKQTAQEQMAVMQIEMDKLKAIIDKPEAKTGRVMNVSDLQLDTCFWSAWDKPRGITFRGDNTDKRLVEAGIAFHDKETAEKHLKYLKLEQELRRAQIADGGAGEKVIAAHSDNAIVSLESIYHHKVSFTTDAARDAFIAAHTIKQIILLIRGV